LGVRLRCFGVKVEDLETGGLGFEVIRLDIEVIVLAVGGVGLGVE
jgi:hypothetical protein